MVTGNPMAVEQYSIVMWIFFLNLFTVIVNLTLQANNHQNLMCSKEHTHVAKCKTDSVERGWARQVMLLRQVTTSIVKTTTVYR